MNMTRTRSSTLVVLILFGLWLVPYHKGIPVIPALTPAVPLSVAARSLWREGSPTSSELVKLKEQAVTQARTAGVRYWQDVFAISSHGAIYPKHSLLFAALSAPFYGLFGEAAFVLLPLMGACVTLIALLQVVGSANPKGSTVILIALGTCGTQIALGLHHYFYSYDIFEPLFVLMGMAIALSMPVIGMALIPFAVLIRPSVAIVLPFVVYAMLNLLASSRDRRRALRGFALGCAVVAVWNWYVWGGPLTTAYHRIPLIEGDGTLGGFSHSFGFNLSELFSEWRPKLMDATHGIVPWNWSLLFVPATLWWSLFSPHRRAAFALLAATAVAILYGLSYEDWMYSYRGNRFVLTGVFLHLAAFGIVIPEIPKAGRRQAERQT